MARPITIKDETILEAARAVFLERGIQGTTAEVAERAGVSEGTVFNRFKSKIELFQAAMQLAEPAWLKTLGDRVGEGEVRDNLLDLGAQIIAFFRTILPLMMMAWSNPAAADDRPLLPGAFSGPNPPPLRALKQIAAYFEAEMRRKRMRRHDPEVLARAFLGPLHSYVFFELLLAANEELPLSEEVFLRGLVNLLWNGAAPRPKGS
jgi:AcrR family transcriptional regulator